jgi:hypothetical protein
MEGRLPREELGFFESLVIPALEWWLRSKLEKNEEISVMRQVLRAQEGIRIAAANPRNAGIPGSILSIDRASSDENPALETMLVQQGISNSYIRNTNFFFPSRFVGDHPYCRPSFLRDQYRGSGRCALLPTSPQ